MKTRLIGASVTLGFRLLAGVSLLAATVCVGQELKDDAAGLADLSLEQLTHVEVYTASRHLQSVGDAPSSVTLVTAREIHEHGYRTLADVLETVRGFYVTSDRNYSSLGVRGFSRPGDYNTRILLLVDGHRLNDNVYDSAMIGTEFPIDIDMIERIEIIRGATSSLYGSNALFAVINIFTKQGRDLNGWELASSVASANTAEGRISYGRKMGPLEFLISGSFYGSRGWDRLYFPEYDSPDTNNGIASHADDDQLGSALANASFHDLTLHSAYGTREKGIPTGAYGTVFDNAGTRTTDSHGYVDLAYTHTFAKAWDVLGRAFADKYNYEGTYIYPSAQDANQTSPEFDFGDGRWWGLEGQVGRALPGRQHVVGGTEFRDNTRQNQDTWDLNPYSLDLNDRRASTVDAVYLQDEIKLLRKLQVNAGLRYEEHSHLGASTEPRVAVIYQPVDGTALKFIYGQAFRVPNVYELFYAVAPQIANPMLKPERIKTTEVVWEQRLPKRLSLSTSGFYTKMKDLINQAETEDGSLVDENLEAVTSTGLEVELSGAMRPGSNWVASYEYQQTSDEQTHQLLSNSPRTLGKLTVAQDLLKRRLTASFDAQYRSRVETPDGVSVSPFAVANGTLLARNVVRRVDLSASVYNVLDRKFADPGTGTTIEEKIPQDGRSVRAQITIRLGKQ